MRARAPLITDRAHGLLVAPSDVPGLAATLREVVEDQAPRQRLASRTPDAVSALGIDAVVSQMEDVYTNMRAQ